MGRNIAELGGAGRDLIHTGKGSADFKVRKERGASGGTGRLGAKAGREGGERKPEDEKGAAGA